MSENGSPLAASTTIVATVKKAKKVGAPSSSSSSSSSAPSPPGSHGSNIALEISGKGGAFLDLSAPGAVDGMDPAMKKTAMNKLKTLQDEVAVLMAKLNS